MLSLQTVAEEPSQAFTLEVLKLTIRGLVQRLNVWSGFSRRNRGTPGKLKKRAVAFLNCSCDDDDDEMIFILHRCSELPSACVLADSSPDRVADSDLLKNRVMKRREDFKAAEAFLKEMINNANKLKPSAKRGFKHQFEPINSQKVHS